MRAPAVSFAKRFAAAALAALLTFTLLPANAFAEGEGELSGVEEAREGNSTQADKAVGASAEVDDSTSSAVSTEAGTSAASLMGQPASFVNADVALDGEPIVGSFTVDGMTFAVADESTVELVGVSQAAVAALTPASSEAEADGPASEASKSAFILPESVDYEDIDYAAASIGAYAFYLSGVTSVELPASVTDVDDRAFRSSDVASIEVVEGNPNYSSFDGALYDADQLSLLLIPEGKQGTALLPKTAESAAPSVFSHCPLVTQIAVEEGSAAFASENGLLYDASLETLLRVPAGATEITIREGCTTIAAGAMEACASLATINAPASVTSISPYLFEQQPETVMAPVAVSAVESDNDDALAEERKPAEAAPQLTALVALSSVDDDLPVVTPSAITVSSIKEENISFWEVNGFSCLSEPSSRLPITELQASSTYSAIQLPDYPGETAKKSYIYLHTADYGQLAYKVPVYYDRPIYWLLDNLPLNTFTRQGYTCTGIYDNYGNLLYEIEFVTVGGQLRERLYSHNSGVWWASTGQIDQGHVVGKFIAQSDVWAAAKLVANNYNLSFNTNGGSNDKPADVTVTFDSVLPSIGQNKPKKTGYTFGGWYDTSAAAGGNMYYDADNKATAGLTWLYDGHGVIYARWIPNSYTVEYRDRADTTTISKDTGFVYDAARNLAAKPSSGVSVGYTAVGWATSKNQSSADYDFGSSQKNLATSGTKKLYLAERPNAYTVTFDAAGGTAASDISATYDQELTLPASTRQGYAFAGWKDEATGTTYQAGNAKNLTAASNATVKLVAQWDPVIAAEVPLYATAKVDLLGIEEQQQAQAYIKSLCGEPLRVASIELMPLPGARELFGDDVSQVRLEACAGADATPVFSLTIDATTFLSGGEPLLALKMEGYGDEVPISYRFDIPDELLPTLVEATKPVCQVTYTVERA